MEVKGGKMKQEKLINRYLDNEATSAEQEFVEKLLQSDKKFKTIFNKLEETNLLLNKVENEPVPDDIYKRVLSSVKYQSEPKPFYLRLAPALTATILSFALGTILTTFLFSSQIQSTEFETYNYADDIYTALDLDDVINYYYD